MSEKTHRPGIKAETKEAVDQTVDAYTSDDYDPGDGSFDENIRILLQITDDFRVTANDWQQAYLQERQTAQAAITQLNQTQETTDVDAEPDGVEPEPVTEPSEEIPDTPSTGEESREVDSREEAAKAEIENQLGKILQERTQRPGR